MDLRMLPWLLDLGLSVMDLGLAATAVALVVEGLPSAVRRRVRPDDAHCGAADEADADERDEHQDRVLRPR